MREFSKFGIFVLFALSACSQKPGLEITKQQYGAKWPFTVASGQLECVNKAVIFHAKGKSYALNDVAKKKGFAPIEEIGKEDIAMFKMAAAIAKTEHKPVAELIKTMKLPTQINIKPILERGLRLCKK